MTTDDFLSAASDFNLLSLRDLLAARDQFFFISSTSRMWSRQPSGAIGFA
jgi:hypothetical protein